MYARTQILCPHTDARLCQASRTVSFLPSAVSRFDMLNGSAALTTPFRNPPRHRSTRWVIRGTLAAFGHRVRDVTGADHLSDLDEPFVAALNHSQRVEAFLVPALLAWIRGGRIIRFLADWNFMLIPPVYALYRSARVIPVTAKRARPRVLNCFQSWVAPPPTGFSRARRCLGDGMPVGLFVEGTVNRHPSRLLRGHRGAARLSLDKQVPVLPIGIRFPDHSDPDAPIADAEPIAVHIGSPLPPPTAPAATSISEPSVVSAWHARMMRALSRLSGKEWPYASPRSFAPSRPLVLA